MKRLWITILGNIGIITIAIILYSPGLFALRPTDESIFRAGSSIFCVILLCVLFYITNKNLIQKKTINGTQIDRNDIQTIQQMIKATEPLKSKDAKKVTETIITNLAKIYFLLNTMPNTGKNKEIREQLDFYIDSAKELFVVLFKLETSWTVTQRHLQNWKENLKACNSINDVFKTILDDLADDTSPDFSYDVILERARLDTHKTDDILAKYDDQI